MHILTILLFAGLLILAVGLMISMLKDYGDRIVLALLGAVEDRSLGAVILEFPSGSSSDIRPVSWRKDPLPLAA
jgi:hypothetical protein